MLSIPFSLSVGLIPRQALSRPSERERRRVQLVAEGTVKVLFHVTERSGHDRVLPWLRTLLQTKPNTRRSL